MMQIETKHLEELEGGIDSLEEASLSETSVLSQNHNQDDLDFPQADAESATSPAIPIENFAPEAQILKVPTHSSVAVMPPKNSPKISPRYPIAVEGLEDDGADFFNQEPGWDLDDTAEQSQQFFEEGSQIRETENQASNSPVLPSPQETSEEISVPNGLSVPQHTQELFTENDVSIDRAGQSSPQQSASQRFTSDWPEDEAEDLWNDDEAFTQDDSFAQSSMTKPEGNTKSAAENDWPDDDFGAGDWGV